MGNLIVCNFEFTRTRVEEVGITNTVCKPTDVTGNETTSRKEADICYSEFYLRKMSAFYIYLTSIDMKNSVVKI